MSNISRIIIAVFALSCGSAQAVESTHTIKVVHGADSAEYMDCLGSLRLETFKEFPYLYVGTKEIEDHYVGWYPKDPNTLFGIAQVQGKFAGILTGVPLRSLCNRDLNTQNACEKAGLVIADYYYLGEVITLKEFRNQGIATSNFKALEENAKKLGYKHTCFITVEREENHPLKPADYKGPASLFTKLGYTKTDSRFPFLWPTIQQNGSVIQDFENFVVLWIKEL